MKKLIRLIFISCLSIILGSWMSINTKASENYSCTMDIFAENNTGVTVEYVKLESSYETKTFWNIPGNGGNDSGYFEWDVSEGFAISVRLAANPGTGSIKVYKGVIGQDILMACRNFTNNSSATTYVFWEDFADTECPGGYYVIIETTGC